MNATAFAQLMAAYNTWMNEKLYRLCSKIPDADRKKDLGAFFGSIHNTLDHIVWADEALLIRLRDEDRAIERHQPPPISDFDELWKARQVFDDEISSWAEGVSDAIVDQPYEFKSKIYNKTRNIRRYVVPPQNPVDRTIVDVSALGIKLAILDASLAVRPARDRQIEPPAAARARAREPRLATAAGHYATQDQTPKVSRT